MRKNLAISSITVLSEGGYFKAHLMFPKEYPQRPPKMKFVTDIWHPNGKNVLIMCFSCTTTCMPGIRAVSLPIHNINEQVVIKNQPKLLIHALYQVWRSRLLQMLSTSVSHDDVILLWLSFLSISFNQPSHAIPWHFLFPLSHLGSMEYDIHSFLSLQISSKWHTHVSIHNHYYDCLHNISACTYPYMCITYTHTHSFSISKSGPEWRCVYLHPARAWGGQVGL